MHLQDGVLSAPVLAGGAVLAAAGVGWGLRRLDEAAIPRTAVLAAAFFALSLVAVPLGPTSVHLVLGGLMGLVLGAHAFPAVAAALVLQAALFGFGGLASLGVNTVILAGPPVLVAALARPLVVRAAPPLVATAAGAAAGASVALSASLMATALRLSDAAYAPAAPLVIATNLPLMVIEAVVTASLVGFLVEARPDLLGRRAEVRP